MAAPTTLSRKRVLDPDVPKDLKGNELDDEGYEVYYDRLAHLSVRVFYGHVQCMAHNAGKMHGSMTRAMLDLKAGLDAKECGFDDPERVEYVLHPERRPKPLPKPISDDANPETVPEPPLVVGSRIFCLNLSSTQLVQRRVHVDGAGLQPDPDWKPPVPEVAFAVHAALSLFDYTKSKHWTCKILDISRFADPMVIRRAQAIFGQSIRYIKFTDARPVVCGVSYSDGKVSRVCIFCGAPSNHLASQASFDVPIEDLWNRKKEDKEEAADRGLPEYKVFVTLFREAFAGLNERATGKVHILQKYLEMNLASDYASMVARRANKLVPVEWPVTWADVGERLKSLLQEKNYWKNVMFLWTYDVYISTYARMKLIVWNDVRREANSLCVMLNNWTRTRTEWLLDMQTEALETHLKNEFEANVIGTAPAASGAAAGADSSDDEDEAIAQKYGLHEEEEKERRDESAPMEVHVMFGSRGTGKSIEIGKERAHEAFTLYEVIEYKRRFPSKPVVLSMCVASFAGAKANFDRQRFVSGTFNVTFSIKRDVQTPSSIVGTYTTTVSDDLDAESGGA
jgi:hypothetical protein